METGAEKGKEVKDIISRCAKIRRTHSRQTIIFHKRETERERGNINERKRSGERKGEEGRGEETPFC